MSEDKKDFQLLSTGKRDRSAPEPGFASPIQAAWYLSLSKAMIHKMINDGEVPTVRYGRSVRIPWNWLRSQVDAATFEKRSVEEE
jgi:excisionase family DNA binding protein